MIAISTIEYIKQEEDGKSSSLTIGLKFKKSIKSIHVSYTIFYIIGTYGAIHIPVVGMTPLKSLEQMIPLGMS